MKRLTWIGMAIGGVIMMVMLLIVWKQGQVSPSGTTGTTRPPFGNQKQLGTSALSHGGPAEPVGAPAAILDGGGQAAPDRRARTQSSPKGLDAGTVRGEPGVTSSGSVDLHPSGSRE